MAKELTTREVAERLGVAQSSVRVWLNYEPDRFPNARQVETLRGPVWIVPESDLTGITARPRGRPAKLNKEQVREIRRLADCNQAEIAEQYGVSASTIGRIRRKVRPRGRPAKPKATK